MIKEVGKRIVIFLLVIGIVVLQIPIQYVETYAEEIVYTDSNEEYEFKITSEETIAITRYLGNEEIVNIPETINGKRVEK